jgi:hypothetical protein
MKASEDSPQPSNVVRLQFKNATPDHMSTADLDLGQHWDQFIKAKLSTGKYGSVGEVVREALRYMEVRWSTRSGQVLIKCM